MIITQILKIYNFHIILWTTADSSIKNAVTKQTCSDNDVAIGNVHQVTKEEFDVIKLISKGAHGWVLLTWDIEKSVLLL